MTRIVTGLFEKHRDVDLVIEHLVQEFGILREYVQVHALDAANTEARSPQDSDLGIALPDLGLPEVTAHGYAEGMRGGSVLVAAWVDDAHVERVLRAYREYGAAEPKSHAAALSNPADGQEQRIRLRAYYLWEQEGCPEGRDLEFWDRARRAMEGEAPGPGARAPQQFAGETGAAPLPERDRSPGS